MEEPNPARAHQLGGDGGRGRLANELLELGDPLPVAEVLEEAPRVVRAAGDVRALARLGEVPLDTAPDERHLVSRKGAPHADCAGALEVVVQRGHGEPIACGKRNSRSGSYLCFTAASRA